ncbi:MAG: nuclear transport factor 2 family protein [Bacteroidota bacterium]
MKKSILLAGLSLAICAYVWAPHTESQTEIEAVRTAVNHYLLGSKANSRERVTQAFDLDASMKFVRDGKQVIVPIPDYLANINPGPERDMAPSVVSIDVEGTAATAKLISQYPDFYFVDYMQLLKIDGEWKIVSKIFHRVDQARE